MSNDPRLLKIFISYAHEDVPIANAVSNCLQTALGNVFAVINIDRTFLETGSDFRDQIKARLAESDVFISLYAGLDKQWPAWEIGYFESLIDQTKRERKLVPIFLKTPPAPIDNYQGLHLEVPPERLQSSVDEYRQYVTCIDAEHPMCRFVAEQQQVADELRRVAGFLMVPREARQNPVTCVQNMMIEIFSHLRTSIEATFKPQKQILIRTTDAALQSNESELPDDAILIPVGVGDPMSIFGLPNRERTWQSFIKEAALDAHVESWRAAIVSVVTSSLDSRINVDNSQIIVSTGGEKTYRLILTSALKFYDGKREFNLYFVETLKRGEYGERRTTMLLKALELVCRFRFMFFERGSEFSSSSLKLTPLLKLPNKAARLIRELNILGKDAREAGLDQPAAWLELINGKEFENNVEIYNPLEKAIRATSARILEARGNEESLSTLKDELVGTLTALEQDAAGGNGRMIQQMTTELQAETAVNKPDAAHVAV